MAYVHATSWQETYVDVLEDHIIRKFDFENRKKMWSEFFEKDTPLQGAYIVSDGDKLITIASWREIFNRIELLTLYVLKDFQRQSIGKALFKQVEKQAFEKDKPLITWVIKGNKARIFYEKMGMKFIKEEKKKLGELSICELMFSN